MPARATPTAYEVEGHRRPGRGEVADATLQLQVAACGGALRAGDDGLDRDLVGREDGRERTGHELGHRDRAAPGGPLGDHVAAQ